MCYFSIIFKLKLGKKSKLKCSIDVARVDQVQSQQLEVIFYQWLQCLKTQSNTQHATYKIFYLPETTLRASLSIFSFLKQTGGLSKNYQCWNIIKVQMVEKYNMDSQLSFAYLDPDKYASQDMEMDNYFVCPICLGVVIDPQVCQHCDKAYCKSCLVENMQCANRCGSNQYRKIGRFAMNTLNAFPFKSVLQEKINLIEQKQQVNNDLPQLQGGLVVSHQGVIELVKCPDNHDMKKYSGNPYNNGSVKCDVCYSNDINDQKFFFRCIGNCNFDVCSSCYVLILFDQREIIEQIQESIQPKDKTSLFSSLKKPFDKHKTNVKLKDSMNKLNITKLMFSKQ
ncbi:UNKNOWN [Stylonychia lemnae]|uniref:KKT2/KKT3 zinc finger domain-containing protein n=1 Tax=Stylonychia lemnae TaxID=5949 RepID=A0A078AEU0_STYLE|nr:UNKNOWN [Stylonychia lemnae]|eukprot:CDW80789.1 UNKNOWN [Stylonychia lemnae]